MRTREEIINDLAEQVMWWYRIGTIQQIDREAVMMASDEILTTEENALADRTGALSEVLMAI